MSKRKSKNIEIPFGFLGAKSGTDEKTGLQMCKNGILRFKKESKKK